MSRKGSTVLLAATFCLLTSSKALGCVGSGIFYDMVPGVVFVNLFFASVQAGVAFALYKIRFWRAFRVMVLAAAFSLLTALPLVRPVTEVMELRFLSGPRVFYLSELFWVTVGVTFVLTVLFEMPFCIWLFRRSGKSMLRGALFCLLSRLVTYAFLFVPMTYGSMSYSISGDGMVQKSADWTRNREVTVYFLDSEDGDLWRMKLDGGEKTFLRKVGFIDKEASLFGIRQEDSDKWRLVAKRDGKDRSETTVLSDFEFDNAAGAELAAAAWLEAFEDSKEHLTWFTDLRREEERHRNMCPVTSVLWGFSFHTVPPRGSDRSDWISKRLRYQTPFEVCNWYSPALLPHNEAIVQVDGQIFLVNMRNGTMAFLAEGHSPLVVPSVEGETMAGSVVATENAENI